MVAKKPKTWVEHQAAADSTAAHARTLRGLKDPKAREDFRKMGISTETPAARNRLASAIGHIAANSLREDAARRKKARNKYEPY